jgi:hypothetical protein
MDSKGELKTGVIVVGSIALVALALMVVIASTGNKKKKQEEPKAVLPTKAVAVETEMGNGTLKWSLGSEGGNKEMWDEEAEYLKLSKLDS